jgi:hypothetical protein
MPERGTEQHRSEHDERERAEHRSRLLQEVHDLVRAPAQQPAEHHPAGERRDEPGAAERRRDAVGERRSCDRADLEPRRIDGAQALRREHGGSRGRPRDRPGQEPVADLLQDRPEATVSTRARHPGEVHSGEPLPRSKDRGDTPTW